MQNVSDDIRDVRERLVNGLLVAACFAIIPALILGIYRTFVLDAGRGLISIGIVYGILLVATILRRRLSFTLRAVVILGLFLEAGVESLVRWGMMSGGFLWLIMVVVLSAILFGVRAGIAAILFGTALAVVVAILVTRSIISFEFDIDEYAVSPTTWSTDILFFVFSATVLVVVLGFLYRTLIGSFESLRLRTEELREANERLSAEMVEREEAERKLRQAEKMEVVGRLASGVAHDFNNLLHAITGFTEIALAELDERSPTREHLEEVTQAADSAADLVGQLLVFSRDEATTPERIKLDDVINGLMNMLGRVLGRKFSIDSTHAPDLRDIRAEKGRIEQIVVNLCVNARDAMPKGGTISIVTRNAHLGPEFRSRFPWHQEGEFVLLRVSDTGMGMPADVAERIFEPFYTTKTSGEGTGLGLSTVYGIVKQFNGVIDVESTEGTGTTFSVYFPAADIMRISNENG